MSDSGDANQKFPFLHFPLRGGERGIRTPDTLARILPFQGSAFNRSAISPKTSLLYHIFFLVTSSTNTKLRQSGVRSEQAYVRMLESSVEFVLKPT